MLNEMLGIGIQLLPIPSILCQIKLLYSPEDRYSLLGHGKHILVLNGKENKATWVFHKKWLICLRLGQYS
jgi:hypothetical protein